MRTPKPNTEEPPARRAPRPENRDARAITVEVSDAQGHMDVDRDAVACLVRGTLGFVGIHRAAVSVVVTDDATIRAINQRHLGHDWPTDVIAFELSEPGDAELAAEVVVSAEMAAATARQAQARPWDELALYLVHGLLHLAGHDDQTPESAAAMRRREADVLDHLGLANTFALVATGDPARANEERLP